MTEPDDATRMPLTSEDIVENRLAALRELFPEVFTEGAIDFAKFKQALGEFADDSPERYGLSWAGKSEAIRAVQSLSSGTLAPRRDESVEFDTTENLIIEGDNLEVLKLLQRSYYGKVKMIYIDPPYNTGNEFIYPDNFREGFEDYLKYSGQVGDDGARAETNTETSGRFHSKWLNMMYPRLFLAKNLLREDGLIFVSIDDNEVHNLRLLLNEVFGEENFIAQIAWEKMYTTKNDASQVSVSHEYILCYARSNDLCSVNLLPRTQTMDDRYKNHDDDPRGVWKPIPLYADGERKNGRYVIHAPGGRTFEPEPNKHWRYREEEVQRLIRDGRIYFGKEGNSQPNLKRFLSEVQQGSKTKTLWKHNDVGSNDSAKREMKALFQQGEPPFSFPKPSTLIAHMLCIITAAQDEDIVLDFFAGSGTTAHAVLEQNKEDNGNRKFILVQLPEPTGDADLPTIADVCKERVRRVIKKLNDADNGKLDLASTDKPDRGFKALKLTSSNFKLWNADEAPKDADELAQHILAFADHVLPDRSQEDILYELLLKAGLSLTAMIEPKQIAGHAVFSVADGNLLICLEDEITQETLRGMIELKPESALCLDKAFKCNDQLKTNIVLEMKAHEIKFHTV